MRFGGCLCGPDAEDNGPVDIVGVTTDVPVVDLGRRAAVLQQVLGRGPDLRPDDQTLEWGLRRTPEIAVRVIARADWHETRAPVRLGLGVADVDAAHERLRDAMPELPAVRRKPGVIALLELHDPDGNPVVVWQDLLTTRVPVQ